MTILQLNKELLDVFCVFSRSESSSWRIRLKRLIILLFLFVCLLFGWSTSVIFIIKYRKSDLRSALYAVFQVAGEFSANFTVFIACVFPQLIKNIFIKLDVIREHGKRFYPLIN